MAYNQGGYGGGGYGNSGYGSGGGGYGNTGGYGQQQQQGGYGSNPYGAGGAAGAGAGAGRYESNRYGNNAPQQGGSYSQQASNPYGGGGYGGQQQQPQQQASGYGGQSNRYQQNTQGGYGGESVEMSQVGGAQNGYHEKATLWEDARDIVTACDTVQKQDFPELSRLQQLHYDSTDPKQYGQAVIDKEAEIEIKISSFQQRLKRGTERPGVTPDEHAELGRALKKVKALYESNFKQSNDFRQKMKGKYSRQYKIANPRATDSEIDQAVKDIDHQDGQVFAQSLMNADRKGQSTSTLQHVRSRNEAIAKIAQQMEEVVTLFEQMNSMVLQQQTQVDTIEHQAQNVETDVEQANVQLDGAVVKARAARKKKWICLGIVVAIILVIVIIVAAVVAVNNAKNNAIKSG